VEGFHVVVVLRGIFGQQSCGKYSSHRKKLFLNIQTSVFMVIVADSQSPTVDEISAGLKMLDQRDALT
jgi:hypothetical protein